MCFFSKVGTFESQNWGPIAGLVLGLTWSDYWLLSIYIYIYMALDRSGAYIFGKNCIISPVLKQKWPKKKDKKRKKKRNFLKRGFLGRSGLSKGTKRRELGQLSM